MIVKPVHESSQSSRGGLRDASGAGGGEGSAAHLFNEDKMRDIPFVYPQTNEDNRSGSLCKNTKHFKSI